MDVRTAVGKEAFDWISNKLNSSTTLVDMPQSLLETLAGIDITVRDYPSDPASITAIALLAFAYRMKGRMPLPQHGPRDIALLKVLCKEELRRRSGDPFHENSFWKKPLCEIIAGEAGDRIRQESPVGTPHKGS